MKMLLYVSARATKPRIFILRTEKAVQPWNRCAQNRHGQKALATDLQKADAKLNRFRIDKNSCFRARADVPGNSNVIRRLAAPLVPKPREMAVRTKTTRRTAERSRPQRLLVQIEVRSVAFHLCGEVRVQWELCHHEAVFTRTSEILCPRPFVCGVAGIFRRLHPTPVPVLSARKSEQGLILGPVQEAIS